jgi:hypothetical protein
MLDPAGLGVKLLELFLSERTDGASLVENDGS